MNRLLLTAFALTLLTAAPASMQAGENQRNPEARAQMKERRQRIMAALTPEEKARFQAARQIARKDPALQAARASGDRRALRQARRDALLRADPSLAPVMAKARAAARGR